MSKRQHELDGDPNNIKSNTADDNSQNKSGGSSDANKGIRIAKRDKPSPTEAENQSIQQENDKELAEDKEEEDKERKEPEELAEDEEGEDDLLAFLEDKELQAALTTSDPDLQIFVVDEDEENYDSKEMEKEDKKEREFEEALGRSKQLFEDHLLEFVDIDKPLKSGAQGKVYEGKYGGREVIIKVQFENDDANTEEKVLKALAGEKNIVKFYSIFRSQGLHIIVMEKGESLADKLEKKNGPFAEEEAKAIFREVIAGLLQMNLKKFAHQDVKLENLILVEDTAKLIDFGYAEEVTGKLVGIYRGTPRYYPFEFYQHVKYDVEKVDIWCAGVTLHKMLTNTFPFAEGEDDHAINWGPGSVMSDNILQGRRNNSHQVDLSDLALELIDRMLATNFEKRISLREVAEHDWLKIPLTTSKAA